MLFACRVLTAASSLSINRGALALQVHFHHSRLFVAKFLQPRYAFSLAFLSSQLVRNSSSSLLPSIDSDSICSVDEILTFSRVPQPSVRLWLLLHDGSYPLAPSLTILGLSLNPFRLAIPLLSSLVVLRTQHHPHSSSLLRDVLCSYEHRFFLHLSLSYLLLTLGWADLPQHSSFCVHNAHTWPTSSPLPRPCHRIIVHSTLLNSSPLPCARTAGHELALLDSIRCTTHTALTMTARRTHLGPAALYSLLISSFSSSSCRGRYMFHSWLKTLVR